MTRESLEITADACVKLIKELDIPDVDKLELMINIFHFLDYETYDKNIDLLNNKPKVITYRKKR